MFKTSDKNCVPKKVAYEFSCLRRGLSDDFSLMGHHRAKQMTDLESVHRGEVSPYFSFSLRRLLRIYLFFPMPACLFQHLRQCLRRDYMNMKHSRAK